MKTLIRGAAVALLAIAHSVVAAQPAPLTLDDLYRSPSLFGSEPSAPRWAPDSGHFAFSWNSEGLPQRQLWVSSADGRDLRRINAGEDGDVPVSDFLWSADGQTVYSLRDGVLWASVLQSGQSRELATLGRGSNTLQLSPAGGDLAYLLNGDLWVVDLTSTATHRLTDLAVPSISALDSGRYRRPEVEIGPGIWGGPTFSWSPDGRTIAVHHVDRRGMRKVPFPDYLADETAPNEVRRGYPGDANEARRVGLIEVATGNLSFVEGLPSPEANQIIDFSWSPGGALLIDIASDTAEDRWLYRLDRGAKRPNPLWHSQRPQRIYTSFASTWSPDGEAVVFLSDIEDRYGLYRIDGSARASGPNGANPRIQPQRLGDAGADVLGPPLFAGDAGDLFYPGNGAGPRDQHLYRVRGAANGMSDAEQLTHRPGLNQGYPSPNGRFLAVRHSADSAPPELYSLHLAEGREQQVTRSPAPEFAARPWARARYVSFASRIDDYTLHAKILEPAVLEPGRRYPVLFGPMYSNTVRNRWAGQYSRIQQLMVAKGYIVVQVDMRGSTGYGRAFREEFLVDFAGDDIEDIASAVEYLKSQPHVDTQRMGIWGSSYGGTLSVYTLLKKPGLFKAGVAAAAAVDPHFFGTDDVAIVRRPDTHPEVFANTAARYAGNLEDHLLIIHGMQDQVVPFKTTVALAEELIRQGKDFDFAFAPGATHAWSREAPYSRYLFGKLLQHFDRYLQPDAGPTPP